MTTSLHIIHPYVYKTAEALEGKTPEEIRTRDLSIGRLVRTALRADHNVFYYRNGREGPFLGLLQTEQELVLDRRFDWRKRPELTTIVTDSFGYPLPNKRPPEVRPIDWKDNLACFTQE